MEETTLKAALQALVTDPELTDLELRGSDVKIVHASRYLLASRSSVFRAMLLGKFKESTDRVVAISHFTGVVIQALVEYICTDSVSLLGLSNEELSSDESAPALVSLASAMVERHGAPRRETPDFRQPQPFFCFPNVAIRTRQPPSTTSSSSPRNFSRPSSQGPGRQ